jgi:hypothetical protein
VVEDAARDLCDFDSVFADLKRISSLDEESAENSAAKPLGKAALNNSALSAHYQ